jgi:hypothetical protein
LAVGCAGEINPPGGAGTGPGSDPTSGGRAPATDEASAKAGKMPMRRLSRDEYNRTVRDLLGDSSNPGDALPQDALGPSGFTSPGIVGSLEVGKYQETAEAVAATALASRPLTELLGCDAAGAGEEACIGKFVRSFGRRAYRRPLLDTEVERYVALYQNARKTLSKDVAAAVGIVIRGFLQSAFFLYHWELGLRSPTLADGAVRLNPDEVASRLSYFLWGTMPDTALFSAADEGELASAEDVARQAERMLADPKARESVSAFFVQLLGLQNVASVQKDPDRYPEFTPALGAAMQEETKTFATQVILSGDAKLRGFSAVLRRTGPCWERLQSRRARPHRARWPADAWQRSFGTRTPVRNVTGAAWQVGPRAVPLPLGRAATRERRHDATRSGR